MFHGSNSRIVSENEKNKRSMEITGQAKKHKTTKNVYWVPLKCQVL